MIKTRLNCKIETPLVMHGARGEQFVELRAAAIKGLARYWFRAALGGIATSDLVQRVEGYSFGDNHTFGKRISISLDLPWRYQDVVTKECRLNPHKGSTPTSEAALSESSEVPDGVAESTPKEEGSGDGAARENKSGSIPLFSALKPGTQFQLQFAPQMNLSEGSAAFDGVLASTWLSSFCGGLGTRMRRGLGSFSIEAISGYDPGLILPFPRTGLSAVAEFYQSGVKSALTMIERCLKDHGTQTKVTATAFPSIDRELPIYLALLPEGEEHEVRKEVMLKLRGFKDPAFGLPYRINGKFVVPKERQVGGRIRHASPLWITLKKLDQGWCMVCTIVPPYPDVTEINPGKIVEFAKSFAGESYEVRIG